MTVAYQMPVRTELAKRVGPRLWRKTILRAGKIAKDGYEVDVDRSYLETLVANFTAGAMPAVPFQLADAQNRHNADPERTRGRLHGLELTADDQLVGLFEATDDGARLLDKVPYLGASVSIDPVFKRADGRDCGPTLLHVCGTLDPEVNGLGEWVRADLSADYGQVIDFSTPSDSSAANGGQLDPTRNQEATVPAPALTQEELTAIRSVLPILQKAVAEPDADPTVDHKDEPPAEPEFSDAELDDIVAAIEDDDKLDGEASVEQSEPELVAASAEHVEALNLAKARIDAQGVELARLRNERDLERYEAERLSLAKDYGIPADVTELARSLLMGSGRTVELSAGKTADAGAIVRKVLHELGRRYAKALDLGAEYGSADAVDDAERRRKDNEAFIAQANREFGRAV